MARSGNPKAPAVATDRFGRRLRDLRISVTDRCNFRCPYCMPAEVYGQGYKFLPRKDILSFEEIERLARILVGLGARKLRITGGEPLVRSQLPRLVARLAAIPGVEDLAMTTNGYLLEDQATELAEAGLKRVTVSVDSLDDDVFKRMNGRDYSVDRVLSGIEAARRVGLRPIKLNCVVQRGVNEHTLVDLARHFKGSGHIVRFIEFMDVGTLNRWDLAQVVSAGEILEQISSELPLEPAEPNYPGEVARRYRYRDGDGEIGLIASVSQPFCGDCTRARLSAEGSLVTCLFAAGGRDLKEPMRAGASDAELRELCAAVWAGRSDRYSEERARLLDRAADEGDRAKLEMYQIGG